MAKYTCSICGYVYDEARAYQKQELWRVQNGKNCQMIGFVLFVAQQNQSLKAR